jgi:hypothetical protein
VPARTMDEVLAAALATVPGRVCPKGSGDLLSGSAELGSVS